MEKNEKKRLALDTYLDCFENFDPSDPICRKYCSLSIRCAIESDQKEKMEILEDIVSIDTALMKLQ